MKSKKICFIGNNNGGGPANNGEFAKVRTWLNALNRQPELEIVFLDLYNWKKHPFSLLVKIYKQIKKCDSILLMASVNGTRVLIPIINFFNAKQHKKFTYVFIGSGPLGKHFSSLSNEECNSFLLHHNYGSFKDKRMSRELQKINALFAETELLKNTINDFYSVNNCYVVNNFRDLEQVPFSSKEYTYPIKTVFLSRVNEEKGIFDLISAINSINKESIKITLDIYGPILLEEKNKKQFESFTKECPFIDYKGIIEPELIQKILISYDFLSFPTRYLTESVPGILAESLLCDLPILSSDFPQSSDIISNEYNSIKYEFRNMASLESKIVEILDNPSILNSLKKGCFESSKTYTFEYWKDFILSLIV